MTERNNWTIFVIVLLGLSALSLPRTAPDGTRSQTLRESGTPPGRNQKAAGSAKQEVNGETLEKVEAELNERESALQKVAEYFGARDLFITEEDLKDVILGSSVAVADASELGKLLPPVRQRIALPRNLEVSSEGGPTYFVFRPEIDRRISGHYRIDASIITIPDPQNSHFAYMFDREIESIKRAAEQHGFLLDRFWFPWDTIEPGTEAKGSGSQKIERARRKQDEPGILLFRKNYDKHLFATFLVGETPTSGINKEAFARAVEYHARLCDADPQSDRDLRVVAPVYSGAYPSLELAIQECQRRYKEKDICVYNGSALNPDIPGRIGRLLPEADYHSFVIDSSILRARFAEYCHNALSIEGGGIAFLNEDSSFGTTTFANILKEPRNTPKGPWNSFTLPMHLSRIRAAYEREPGMGVLQHQTVQNLPRETLQLHVNEAGRPSDTIADYSSMTSESEELVLANLLIHISRGNYQLIVMVMTDARDVMFLNRMIEKYCPNVRTATLLSDVVYSHPDYLHLLHGMLVVSYYPLFTLPGFTDALTFVRSGPTQQFASASSQGIYTATNRLLNDLVPPSRPLDDPLLAPWLGVVSYQGIWPVEVLSGSQNTGSAAPSKSIETDSVASNDVATSRERSVSAAIEEKLQVRIPLLLGLVLTGVSILAVLHAIGLYARWGETRWKRWPLGKCFYLAIDRSKDRRFPNASKVARAQVVYGLSGLLLLLVALCLMEQLVRPSFFPVVVAASLVLTCLCVSPLWHSERTLILITIAVTIALAGIGLYLHYWHTAPVLLRYRLVNLSNGVTPLTPALLLLGAGYLACLSQSQRLSNYCRHIYGCGPFLLSALEKDKYLGCCAKCFDAECGASEPSAGSRPAGTISAALGHFWINKPICVSAFIVVCATCVYVGYNHPVLSLEGWKFDAAMFFGLGAGTFVLAIGVIRLLRLWIDMRHILRQLELHPMREAFSAIGSRLTWRSLWLIDRRQVASSMALEYLRRLTWVRWKKTFTAGYLDAIRGPKGPSWNWVTTELDACRTEAEDPTGPLDPDPQSHLSNAATILVQQVFLAIWKLGVTKIDDSKRDIKEQDRWAPLVRMLEDAAAQVKPAVDLKAAPSLGLTLSATGDDGSQGSISLKTAPSGDLATPPPPVEDCLEWLQTAERFVALRFPAYFQPILLHMRSTIAYVTAGYLLLLICIASYPFQPRRLLLTICFVLLAFFVGSMMWVLIQIQRDPILSRLSGTTAGKVEWNREFILQVLTYGVLPTVGLLATMFPALGSGFLNWLEPFMRVFR